MAARMMKPICMLLIAVVLAAAVPRNQAAISCGTVVNSLKPCVPYVFNNAPIGGCCNGVRSLYSAAKTPADRKTVCTCLKSLAGSYSGGSLGKAAGIPSKCGINIPYKISPSTDCSRVN